MSDYKTSDVSILIGHLPERAEMLKKVVDAYSSQDVCEVKVKTGLPGGAAYNFLAREANGRVVALVPDDQVPIPGAIEAAVEVLNEGKIPCNRLTTGDVGFRPDYDTLPDGTPLTFTRSIMIPVHVYYEIGPLIDELSWYIDYDYSNRLVAAGYELVACAGFRMHHLHGDQSWLQGGEAARQHQIYLDHQNG